MECGIFLSINFNGALFEWQFDFFFPQTEENFRKLKGNVLSSRNFNTCGIIFICYVPVYQFAHFVYMFNNPSYTRILLDLNNTASQ